MKKTMVRYLEIVLFFLVATLVILLFATRTSPLYNLLYGDYGNTQASSAMVVGKYWLSGSVPYVDLFNIGGPLYYLFNAIGWFIGGRVGIAVLEIISLALFLFFTKKTMSLLVREPIAWVLTLATLVPFFAMFCGGNSDSEWCLPFLAMTIYIAARSIKRSIFTNIDFMVLSITCGALTMIRFTYGGLVYAVVLFAFFYVLKDKSISTLIINLCVFICGMAAIIIPFFIYFYVKGGLGDMVDATFIYPALSLLQGFDSITIIVHKLVKCTLAAPLFFIGIYYILRKDKNIGILMILISIYTLFFMICGDGSWHYYLIFIAYIPLAMALTYEALNGKRLVISILISLLVLLGICVIPAKRYVSYIISGIPEVVKEFNADLEDYYSQLDSRTLMMVDTDCSYYLINDIKPPYRYFTNQTNLYNYNDNIGQKTYDYVEKECSTDVLITTKRSWLSEELGSYMLVQVYCKSGGNICVYLPYSN